MSATSRSTRFVAPLASAVATAAVLSGAVWIQHSRGGWPFPSSEQAAAPVPVPAEQDMAGMEASSMPERVPVEVTPAMLQALGVRIEEVRQETLTQTIQSVATVAPDESRISHAHTRVAGWVEQLDVNTTGEMVRAGQPLARIFSQELLSPRHRVSQAQSSPADAHVSRCLACRPRRLRRLNSRASPSGW
jgi:Cu(I)/Ag(I) efflux system membrane fusion protein